MTRDEARAIEWDCAQILIRFFNEFDGWRYREMVALFAPDGVWHRQGRALRGAEAILAVLAQRSTTQTVRHVVTNVQVTALDADTAKSLLYVTAYQPIRASRRRRPRLSSARRRCCSRCRVNWCERRTAGESPA